MNSQTVLSLEFIYFVSNVQLAFISSDCKCCNVVIDSLTTFSVVQFEQTDWIKLVVAQDMTVTALPVIKNGCLMVRGKVVLTGVPENVVISPSSSGSAFVGATSTASSSHHVFNLGTLEYVTNLSFFP